LPEMVITLSTSKFVISYCEVGSSELLLFETQ
jgi:hypothetical protein